MPRCRYVLPNTCEMNPGGRSGLAERLQIAASLGCELIEVPADFIKNPTETDKSASKAAALDGRVIMRPLDAHDKGRMAIIQDPQGATFTLWQGKAEIGETHGGPLNQFCWLELTMPDPAGAVAFYTGLSGWSTKPPVGVEDAEYAEWANGGSSGRWADAYAWRDVERSPAPLDALRQRGELRRLDR